MDWGDFMRGFFGHHRGSSRGGDQWPPPPPIPDFGGREDGSSNEGVRGNNPPTGGRDADFLWGRPNRRSNVDHNDEGFENFGNRTFVFGDLFSAMGEMFQEVERSMRDMDSFFGNMNIEDHSGIVILPGGKSILPPGMHTSPSREPSKDDCVRDLVLKDSDTLSSSTKHHNSKHYIPEPDNSNDKVDRDLDELYQKSLLDLSDLPVPSTSEQSHSQKPSSQNSIVPFDFHKGQHFGSSFQKTFQTFSFKNGRWEGEIVKQDQNGKEITRFYQDKDGQRHETTEYFPGEVSSSPSSQRPVIDSDATTEIFTPSYKPSSLFQFLDRFFKPRM